MDLRFENGGSGKIAVKKNQKEKENKKRKAGKQVLIYVQGTIIKTTGGGRTEVLGGFIYTNMDVTVAANAVNAFTVTDVCFYLLGSL